MIRTYMLKLKNLIKGGLGYIFVSNLVNQVIAFASSFILVRILTKNDYGIYSYAFNIYSFFALFCGLGVESACLQVCSENKQNVLKAEGYMRFGLLFGSFFNIILAVVIVVSAQLFSFSIEGTSELLIYFSILPILTTIFNCIQIYYRYNMNNQVYAKNSVINTFLILIGSVAGAFVLQAKGLILFRSLAFLISIVVSVLLFHFPIREIIAAVKLSIQEKKDVIKLSLISALNIATGQLLYLIDVYVVGMVVADSSVVASYKTATIIPNALIFIPNALIVYVYPYFANKKDDKVWVKKSFLDMTKYFTLFNACLTIVLEILAPYIVVILFGEQYSDAVMAFRILLISYFFSASFRKIIGNLLVTQRKLRVNFWVGIAEGIMNIMLNWILVHYLGAIGAAITTLCISIISSCCLVIYFLHYLNKQIQMNKQGVD